jgi:hypothetical protein
VFTRPYLSMPSMYTPKHASKVIDVWYYKKRMYMSLS